MELINRLDNHAALTVAWSIKESIYKAANIPGLSFRNAIALEIHTEKQMGKATLGNAEKIANYYWEEFEEFVLTLALID
jgi:phosphopantetheinyl transferase (holo-ACP synthase)